MFLIRSHIDAQHIANLQQGFLSLRENFESDVPYSVFHLPVWVHPTNRAFLFNALLNHTGADVVVSRTHAPKLTPTQQRFGVPFLLPVRFIDSRPHDAFITTCVFQGDYPKTLLQPQYSDVITSLMPKAYQRPEIKFASPMPQISSDAFVASIVYQFLCSNMQDRPYGVTARQSRFNQYMCKRSWAKL